MTIETVLNNLIWWQRSRAEESTQMKLNNSEDKDKQKQLLKHDFVFICC